MRVQTVKAMLKKAQESQSDRHVAMLNYRATQLSDCTKRTAELLFNGHL